MRKFLLSLALFLLFIPSFLNAQMLPAIIPEPRECEISPTSYDHLERLVIECPDANARDWAERHLKEWYGEYAPKVILSSLGKKDTDALSLESYIMDSDASGVRVKAATLQGVRYALYSLRQVAIAERGTDKVAGWIMPRCHVSDSAKMDFRGIHICWFHETEPWEVERLIRLAAYYKLNYAVVEPWGSFRSDVAPWYGWQDGTMTKQEVRRLKALADDLGITLIPQLNIFGHATMARDGAGKHAALDIAPEYQPLFEPVGGWNWCLSNPETKKLLSALIEELMDAFGNPPYFHIGCDEAKEPSCPECLKHSYSELFVNHLKAMNAVITKRGARAMMWHDMLLEAGDKRFEGFYTNGTKETAEAAVKMPKDIIICDWYYEGARKDYPTLDYFKDLGYDVLTCPWYNASGILAQGTYAAKKDLYGILGTLWHHYYGEDLVTACTRLAQVAWNPSATERPSFWKHTGTFFRQHLRQVGWDMKVTDPRHTGLYYDEIPLTPELNN